jgi:TIR domain
VRVFISYAREDRTFAARIYNALRDIGIDAWLDAKSILPGRRWKRDIAEALRTSDYVVILLSDHSVSKRGYCQSEILDALELLRSVPRDRAFIIPVRINNCSPKDLELQELQWIDLFPDYESGFFELTEYFRALGSDTKTELTSPAQDRSHRITHFPSSAALCFPSSPEITWEPVR